LEMEVVGAVTAETASKVIGIPRSTLRDRNAPRNDDGTYSLPVLVAWLLAQIEDASSAPPGGTSPALEDWRRARARREELSLVRDLRGVYPVARYQQMTAVILQRIRYAAEATAKQFGDEAAALYREALDRAREEIDALTPEPATTADITFRLPDRAEPLTFQLGQFGNPVAEELPE